MNTLTRSLFILSLPVLTACAPITVLYKSDPPGAFISGPRAGGGTFNLLTPTTISYPYLDNNFVGQNMACRTIDSPSAQWPDGSYVSSLKLSICARNSHYIFQKPIQDYRPRPSQPPSISKEPEINPKKGRSITENVPRDTVEQRCLDIGLKRGSVDFIKCFKSLSK